MLDVAIAPLLWRLDRYGIDLGKQAAPLMKYAERIFSRQGFIDALTPPERSCVADLYSLDPRPMFAGLLQEPPSMTLPYQALSHPAPSTNGAVTLHLILPSRWAPIRVSPMEFVKDGQIVLNISADATNRLMLGK